MRRDWSFTRLALLGTILFLGACTEPPTSPDVPTAPEALLASSPNAAQLSAADVFTFPPPGTLVRGARSTLVRNDNGAHMTFRTSGLAPGSVATIWWVIFNNPDECSVPGNCTGADTGNPDVDASSFYAAGHVIGGAGRATFAASLPVGRLTVDPDPDADQLVATPAQTEPGDGILKDARRAEIHLVLRTHGAAIPGLVQHQLSTFNAGCPGAPPAFQGPNMCRNLQFSVHR